MQNAIALVSRFEYHFVKICQIIVNIPFEMKVLSGEHQKETQLVVDKDKPRNL